MKKYFDTIYTKTGVFRTSVANQGCPGVDPFTMEYNYVPRNDAELAHFDGLWAAASNGAKELSGLQAVTFFKQSGVDLGILKQIWGFSTPTATMNLAQFYNALRYICMFQTGL